MLEGILLDKAKLHVSPEGEKVSYSTNKEALRFIYGWCKREMHTIETGCGLSTVIFALAGSKHICVSANPVHIGLVREYCNTKGIRLDSVEFVIDRSEWVLPNLKIPRVDFAFIDGGHAFPIPYIDWFYISEKMSEGAIIGIDDLQIPTIGILNRFLKSSPEWQALLKKGKTAFYRKTAGKDRSYWDYWAAQPFNITFAIKFRRFLNSVRRRK